MNSAFIWGDATCYDFKCLGSLINSKDFSIMRKLYKQTSLALAAGIGLGFAAITASWTLAALAPATAKTQKISDSSQLFAQTTRTINKDDILAAHNKYRQ